jgi:hypothetical protein
MGQTISHKVCQLLSSCCHGQTASEQAHWTPLHWGYLQVCSLSRTDQRRPGDVTLWDVTPHQMECDSDICVIVE